MAVAAVMSLLFSGTAHARDFVARNVTYAEAVAFLSDERLMNQQAEILSVAGKFTRAKFKGLANGAILLKDAAEVPLCSVSRIRITRKSAGPLRRLAGITGGALLGLTLVLPVAIGVSINSETGFRALSLAFTTAGALVGYKGAEKREESMYILERGSHECEGEKNRPPFPEASCQE
jgi:hypothetical protein